MLKVVLLIFLHGNQKHYNQAPEPVYDNTRIKLNFNTDLSKQDKITYNHEPIVNIYNVYRLAPGINNSGVTSENCLFRADMSSSAHANNKPRNILVLGKDFVQGIDNTTIYAEKMYLTNFTVANKTFCLSLHYNGDDSYLFVNGKKIINFKAKDSEIVPYPLCLGNT